MVLGILVALGSALIGAVSTIGTAVAAFCTTTLPAILPVLTQSINVAYLAAKTISAVMQLFEVFSPNEQVEEVGDRALQAAEKEITPDKFEQFDDYMTQIRCFELDPEKSANYDASTKIAAGMAISSLGLERKLHLPEGSMGGLFVLATQYPEYFTISRLMAILAATKDVGMVVDYYADRLDISNVDYVETMLRGVEKTIQPDLDEQSIQAGLHAAKQHLLSQAKPE
ncbi:hypothetical protein V8J88_12930 [Massilia sp. W12]|uniref:hypothetical protein n=1 Tax=Massilia sp. W12 TaxID=3126507 RepID=UPI0030D32AD4